MSRRERELGGLPRTVTLHGKEIAEPTGCEIIFPALNEPCLSYWVGEDVPLRRNEWRYERYRVFRYRNHVNGLVHDRWEYVPDASPLPPQGRLVYPKQTAADVLSWLDERLGAATPALPTCADFPVPECYVMKMLDDVIGHKARACDGSAFGRGPWFSNHHPDEPIIQ